MFAFGYRSGYHWGMATNQGRRTSTVVRVGTVDLEHLKLYAREGNGGREVTPREAITFARHALSHAALEGLGQTLEARSVARQIATCARVAPEVRFLPDDEDRWYALADSGPITIGVAPIERVIDYLHKFDTTIDSDGCTYIETRETT